MSDSDIVDNFLKNQTEARNAWLKERRNDDMSLITKQFVSYVEKKYPNFKVNQQSIGLIQAGVYVALGIQHIDDSEVEMVVYANMKTNPRQTFMFEVSATSAYWAANNLLWRFPGSIKFAIEEAEKHGVYRKSLLKKEEKDEN